MTPGATLRDWNEKEFLSTLFTELEQESRDDVSQSTGELVKSEKPYVPEENHTLY